MAELPVEHIVAVRCDAEQRPERRRRLCLQKVMIELSALGVARATAESRGAKDDSRDMKMVTYLRAKGALDPSLRLHHAAGPSDPALWIPDVCCGVVAAHRLGHPEYWNLLAGRITLHDVD
ncbi:hypothetical protein [Dietzia sp. 179-F 9C3 NHS]|uniref:hypothetical protein n=1 Tax=Dietzia sp. 179-F 9C3 NHS TaxID=3374295 RepID=UPI00387921D5